MRRALLAAGLLIGCGGDAAVQSQRAPVDVRAAESARSIVIRGRVVDDAGAPSAHALVGLVAGGTIAAHVETDDAGAFALPTIAGTWGLSAQLAARGAGFAEPTRFDDDAQVTLHLVAADTVAVSGHVTGRGAQLVTISPISRHHADLFVVAVGSDGTFAARLPRGDRYRIDVIDGPVGHATAARVGDRVDVTLASRIEGPPPAEVVAWIAAHAIAIATTDPAHDLADLAPLAKLVGSARVVAVGEATHGTREFFQLKHRILEELVAELGFSVFAIEANQPECRAINAYVLRGTGDAKTALAGIYFWTWNTQEVLAMIEWMRTWNADPKHAHKLQFTGFDMQTTPVAYANVVAYLAAIGADSALVAPLAVLGTDTARVDLAKASPDEQTRVTTALAAAANLLDARRALAVSNTGVAAFDDARHDVTILQQAVDLYIHGGADGTIRDRAMADNAVWILDHQPAGTRMLVWAHDAHVAAGPTFVNMGHQLREHFGADFVNLGFVFARGAFQAKVPPALELTEVTLGEPPESDVSVAFARTALPLLALDLRALPATGAVHDWFWSPHPVRQVGAVFASERSANDVQTLPEIYDAVVFVEQTTRARPIHE